MVLYKNLQTSTLSLYLAMGKWCRDLLKHVKTHMEIQYIRQKQFNNSNELKSQYSIGPPLFFNTA